MSAITRRIEAKYLLVFWAICLIALSISLPSVLTKFYIYMGMLIGYVQSKTQLLTWLGSNLSELVAGSYLSLRYKFGSPVTRHDGINILLANTLYFAIATTAFYLLLKRFGKAPRAKTIALSALTTGLLMLVIGFSVLASNPNTLLQALSNQPPVEYVVQEGDTCDGIASEHSVSVESLVELNNLHDCILFIGQSIKIPFH